MRILYTLAWLQYGCGVCVYSVHLLTRYMWPAAALADSSEFFPSPYKTKSRPQPPRAILGQTMGAVFEMLDYCGTS